MKRKFTTALVTLFLLSGCARTTRHYADDAARLLRNASEELSAVQRNQELAERARKAGRFAEAAQYSEEASRAEQRVATTSQEAEQIRQQAGHLPDDTLNLLTQTTEAHVQARLASLQTQADNATMVSAFRMKVGKGVLTNQDIDILNKFCKDFLCFHLEMLANQNRLPNDSDYEKFLLNHVLGRFVPIVELKQKAENVIAFAQSEFNRRSVVDIRARALLVAGCNL